MSGASERASGGASGPLLTSRFFAVLNHRGLPRDDVVRSPKEISEKNGPNKSVWVAIPAEELVRPLLGPASIPPAAVISLKLDKLLTLKLLKMKQKI